MGYMLFVTLCMNSVWVNGATEKSLVGLFGLSYWGVLQGSRQDYVIGGCTVHTLCTIRVKIHP